MLAERICLKIALVAVVYAGIFLHETAQCATYISIQGANLKSAFPADQKNSSIKIVSYKMRSKPVTVAEFARFADSHPQWRKENVPSIFADANYLATALKKNINSQQPITQVSWFAAQAFCENEGARLPTWYEWELVAAADKTRRDARQDPLWRSDILQWYSRPSTDSLRPVGSSSPNLYGIYDLHGLVWEWVYDFSSLMVSADNREQGDTDTLRFCGAGAISMNNKDNFAILMRLALLSSLSADSTTRNLGFRCAQSESKKPRRKFL
jgi:formylglycine-generating enzyme